MKRTLGVLALCLVAAAPLAAQTTSTVRGDGAVLRGLDKVAGRSEDITIRAGESAVFGRLTITVTECREPEDDRAADAFAHLVIHDTLQPDRAIFRGWMVASSPALNALDHARFDVWLLRCTRS